MARKKTKQAAAATSPATAAPATTPAAKEDPFPEGDGLGLGAPVEGSDSQDAPAEGAEGDTQTPDSDPPIDGDKGAKDAADKPAIVEAQKPEPKTTVDNSQIDGKKQAQAAPAEGPEGEKLVAGSGQSAETDAQAATPIVNETPPIVKEKPSIVNETAPVVNETPPAAVAPDPVQEDERPAPCDGPCSQLVAITEPVTYRDLDPETDAVALFEKVLLECTACTRRKWERRVVDELNHNGTKSTKE